MIAYQFFNLSVEFPLIKLYSNYPDVYKDQILLDCMTDIKLTFYKTYVNPYPTEDKIIVNNTIPIEVLMLIIFRLCFLL